MLSLEVNPGNCGWLLGPPSPFLERWNVLRTSLIGRQGGEERKIVSPKEKIRETYNMGAWGVWSPLGKGY